MNNRQLVVDFDLQQEDDELVVRATILNHSQGDLDNWTLKFDLPKAIRPREGTRLISHVGSHVTLGPSQQAALPTGEKAELVFSGAVSMIQRLSDLPRGLYVSHGEPMAHLRAELGSHNLETIATGHAIPSSVGSLNPHVKTSAAGSADARSGAAADSVTGLQAIVPRPTSTQVSAGVFSVANRLTYHGCSEATAAIVWLTDMLPLECQASDASVAAMDFAINPELVEEAYLLRIETEVISIQAADAAGFFHAAATLLQTSDAVNNAVRWPCGVIEDRPRFNFRGLMLDCARHFHTKDTVLRTLDLMAQFKLNQFHWHLTDDEGWRLEIQAFPQLTERGAWRGEGEVLESQFGTGPGRYGGFYSRDDVEEVVDYAAARQIEVIPEIDIPGHSRAAIKSYPELLVEEADLSQYCGAQLYTDNVLNPALPGTYQFLHTVLDEVCDLFPGEYIHLGADEVPEGVWQQSPACSEFMAAHGYESAHELQGHLLRDLQAYLAKKGKKLMGWEEAVHGDKLDHTATVNAWGSVPIGTQLANAGYGVVACAAPFAYLDLAWDENAFEPGYYWAGTCDLATCYGYEPTTPELTHDGAQQMIGVQAVLWSELVREPAELEYMLFPRLLAMAETAWTAPSDKDLDHFMSRLPFQLTRLELQGVVHRPIDDIS